MPDDEDVEVKVKPETGSSKKADEGAAKKGSESRLFAHVPIPGTLELHSGNVSANWKRWVLKWTMYELATGLDTKSGKVRIAAMLSSVGQDGLDLFQTFEWKDENELKSYRAVMEKFEKWCTPRGNTMFETFKFGSRMQGESEKIDSYVAALKLQASNCGFGADDVTRRIRDQVVLGLRDKKVQERVLREDDPNLDQVLTIVRAAEVAEQQSSKLSNGDSKSLEVSQVGSSKNQQQSKNKKNKKKTTAEMIKCRFCSREHEKVKEKCPAWQKKCKICDGMNHFAAACTKKKNEANQIQPFTQSLYNVCRKGVTKKTKTMTVLETRQKIIFQIDTGASCNVMSEKDYIRVTGDKSKVKLLPLDMQLSSYGGKTWKPLGKCTLKVSVDSNVYQLICLVVDFYAQPLLGLESCEQLGIVKVLSSDQDNGTVNQLTTTDQLLDEFKDVFTGLGKLEGKYEIKLRDDAKPVIHAPRRVPVALREPLKEWLDKQEAAGVIKKVTEPTDWVSSITIVKEPTKLRMCLDPKELNTAIQREHYLLPVIEEATARMANVKVFSVLDAIAGFWQVELEEESSYFTTFNTPFGRYRFLRMPFGISSAPEVWQRKMHEFAENLNGVEVIADDFLVTGSGDTQEEALRDHDSNLRRMLEKARSVNLKLNREKAKLRLTEVRFMGHLLTKDGVKIDPRKHEAIVKMPKPEDASAVSRILGMVQYLSKFLPKLSDAAEPLRRLTDKNAEWSWTEKHEKSFNLIKSLVLNAPVLAYYDVTKPVTVQSDASDKGIGAVLLQEGRPVTFSSRAMTKTEQNYAQIEKEMLAIVHACTRFHHYLYGRSKVMVETDHKPLETILRKPIGNAPKRLQRMLLAVQDYSLEVVYKKGSEMYISDTLSRAYLSENEQKDANIKELNQIKQFEEAKISDDNTNSQQRMNEITTATGKDEVLQQVKLYIQKGWPERKQVRVEAIPYYSVREQLVTEDRLIFCGDRVVMPQKERLNCMKLIHQSHIGIEGCLRRAREYVYWPRMNAELKDYISSCDICNKFRVQQQKEPLEPLEVPDRAWSTLSADLFEMKGEHFLIVVDHFSNYFEYDKLTTQTTAAVVKSMKRMFSRFGIPEKLVTDNGRQFVSEEFEKFMRDFQVDHVTSSPTYPQSNGKAENAVKICKGLMKKALEGKVDFFLTLLDLRNTPCAATRKSPAQLMFGKRTRTLLPTRPELLEPEGYSNVKELKTTAKEKQADYYNRFSKELVSLSQGAVVRMRLPGQEVWSKGTILKRWGKRSYIVQVGDGTYRRNRRQIRASTEPPPVQDLAVEDEAEVVPVPTAPRRSARKIQRPAKYRD